jgi:hypothetical protein
MSDIEGKADNSLSCIRTTFAGLCDAFDAHPNIYAVAHQVIALDHDVADMNADAQQQRALAVGVLYRLGAAYGLNSAGELDQEAVAAALNSLPACLAIWGSTMFVRSASSLANVPASSLPMSFE